MSRSLVGSLLLAYCIGALNLPALAQTSVASHYKFVTLDYPGAAITYPLGINLKREIAGYYLDANFTPHGFLYQRGKFTPVAYPGALFTAASGINDLGHVSGTYFDLLGFQHGFLMTMPAGCDNDGDENIARCQPVFKSLDFPGAAQTRGIDFEFGPGLGTGAAVLNDRDQVAGLYAATGLYSNGMVFSQGSYRAIDHPLASHAPGLGTRLFGINNLGVLVGDYITQSSPQAPPINYRFLLTGDKYTPVFVPGSDKGGFGTQVNGLNDFRVATGIYSDPAGNGHGFIWLNGQAFTLDYPGSGLSEAHAINDLGDITGAYSNDPTGASIHGFLATLKF